MRIEIKDENKFRIERALQNAIKTFEVFENRFCEKQICHQCIFRYGFNEEGQPLCPNDELCINFDIKTMKEFLEVLKR